MFLRFAFLALVALLGMPATGIAALGADGAVTGWLEVKGERVPLTNIFAAMETDRLEAEEKENVVILLSDKPVPQELRSAAKDYTTWAGEQAQAGQLDGIIIVIDPKTNVWSRGQRLSREHGLTFYFHTATSPEGRKLRFERADSGQAEIAGTVSMTEPMRGMSESDGPWRVEAQFRTAVVQQDQVTARMTGAEALNSPQYKTVRTFLQACKKKDLERIRKTMDASSQAMLAQMVKEQGRAGTLEMLAGMAADSSKMKAAEVVVRGKRATVRLMKPGKDREEYALTVALDEGVWKMSR